LEGEGGGCGFGEGGREVKARVRCCLCLVDGGGFMAWGRITDVESMRLCLIVDGHLRALRTEVVSMWWGLEKGRVGNGVFGSGVTFFLSDMPDRSRKFVECPRVNC
jgi:hypothetical protein